MWAGLRGVLCRDRPIQSGAAHITQSSAAVASTAIDEWLTAVLTHDDRRGELCLARISRTMTQPTFAKPGRLQFSHFMIDALDRDQCAQRVFSS
jgi:hypothetical protein